MSDKALHDYDVIIRVPIRVKEPGETPREAHIIADLIVDRINQDYADAEVVSVECTGPSEEQSDG